MPTESSGKFSVNDGNTTSHDISQSDGDINVLSAQCRWQGVDVTEEETTTTEDFNSNSKHIDNTDGNNTSETLSVSIPSIPDGASLRYIKANADINNSTDTDITLDDVIIETENYNTYSQGSITIDKSGDLGQTKEWCDSTSSISYEQCGDGTIKIDLVKESTDMFGRTISMEAIPSGTYVPAGLDIGLGVEVHYTETTTTSTTYHTQDPSVSGDVSVSYSGTLSDGEWTSWQTLSGLKGDGVNDFNHSISSSNKANLEFEYEYEYVIPDAVGGQLRIPDKDSNGTFKIALADPSDSGLQYDVKRVEINGTTYVVDVVDSGTTDGIEWTKFVHPTHGTLIYRGKLV